MKIGIDGSRAFIKKRTGIEEYSYQVIKNLRGKLIEDKIFLYIRKNQEIDFELPENWKIKTINFWRFWTQIGLSLEMLFHKVDVLFIPAHTVPWIHPKNTIVTIHGLEYEFCPKAYSFWEKIYMRCSIKNSCKWAKKIIAVSENTKKDLINLYGVAEDKISVIYEGYEDKKQETRDKEQENFKFQITNAKSNPNEKILKPYLLFIGRLEERKNIIGIIEAFEILKEKYKISHKLVLAGKPGYGFDKIQSKIQDTRYNNQIILPGFVSEEQKWDLLKNSEAFLFPTLYEGFGIPILEAQSVGTPIVTTIVSSIPEVAGEGALLVDPKKPEEIAQAVQKILVSEELKKDLIQKGLENVKRFSWEKCAEEIVEVLKNCA